MYFYFEDTYMGLLRDIVVPLGASSSGANSRRFYLSFYDKNPASGGVRSFSIRPYIYTTQPYYSLALDNVGFRPCPNTPSASDFFVPGSGGSGSSGGNSDGTQTDSLVDTSTNTIAASTCTSAHYSVRDGLCTAPPACPPGTALYLLTCVNITTLKPLPLRPDCPPKFLLGLEGDQPFCFVAVSQPVDKARSTAELIIIGVESFVLVVSLLVALAHFVAKRRRAAQLAAADPTWKPPTWYRDCLDCLPCCAPTSGAAVAPTASMHNQPTQPRRELRRPSSLRAAGYGFDDSTELDEVHTYMDVAPNDTQ